MHDITKVGRLKDVKKLYAWRARCPTCRTVYYSRDPGSAVYCNRCGTLFDFYPHYKG